MSRRVLKYLLLVVAVQFCFVSCLDIHDASYKKHTVAVVMNQGVPNGESATLSYYNEDDEVLENDAYRLNNGKKIDAFGQDMIITPVGSIYLLCTSPDKMEMINPKTLVSYTTITEGLENPRSISEYNGLLYVVNHGKDEGDGKFEHSFLSVYNLSTNAFIDSIEIGCRAEDVVVRKDVAYVTTAEGLMMIDVRNAMFEDSMKLIGFKEVPAHDNPARALGLGEEHFAISYPGAGTAVFSDKGDLTYFIKMPMGEDGFISADAQNKKIVHSYKDPATGKSQVYTVNLDGSDLKVVAEGENLTAAAYSTNTRDLFVCDTPVEGRNSVLRVIRRGRVKYEQEVGHSSTRMVFYNYTDYVPEEPEDDGEDSKDDKDDKNDKDKK